jgi:hypothetical protein
MSAEATSTFCCHCLHPRGPEEVPRELQLGCGHHVRYHRDCLTVRQRSGQPCSRCSPNVMAAGPDADLAVVLEVCASASLLPPSSTPPLPTMLLYHTYQKVPSSQVVPATEASG